MGFTHKKMTDKDLERLAMSVKKSVLDKRAKDKRSNFKLYENKK